jgi:hypothetical protein
MGRIVALIACLPLVLGGCGDPDQANGTSPPPEEVEAPLEEAPDDDEADSARVTTLVKAEGWRDDLMPGLGDPYAILEVAFDRETAERAWGDNVPADLPEQTGDPADPGIYGSLDDVDFDRQVVAVWSSGESGTCPAWLDDVRVLDDGAVAFTLGSAAPPGTACTMDYRPYRMVLALDRDAAPSPDDLPAEDVTGVPDGLVTAYPAE